MRKILSVLFLVAVTSAFMVKRGPSSEAAPILTEERRESDRPTPPRLDPVDKPYPKDYFMTPVKTDVRLSGTFGELRSNHFHMGIDIKGGIGVPLYAAAEGHVARIKVQAAGYGRVLYIAHPAGYTTVYAHMNRFTDELEAYVKRQQYEREQFEVDLYPPAGRFAFRKGERIGEMGTTGYSFGPHLHFEIRDSKTEKPLNPLLFGIELNDQQPPRMHQIKVYALDEDRRALDSRIYDVSGQGKTYRTGVQTIYVDSDRVGLALKAYDHMNGARNWNGIYAAELWADGALHYKYEMEGISFDHTRYINAHLDYADQVSQKSYFNRLFALPGNRLPIYPEQVNGGVIELRAGQPAKEIQIRTQDASGNTSELRFRLLRGNDAAERETPEDRLHLTYDQAHEVHEGSASMFFSKGTFYEDIDFNLYYSNPERSGIYSSLYHVHDYKTPVHKYYELAIAPIFLPEELRSKAFIAYVEPDGDVVNYGGRWREGRLYARVRDLGDFCVMADTEAPRIIPGYFRSNMQGRNRMTFKITDNFKTSGDARGLRYRATVDGQWILMEYDAKNDLLFHRFDGRIQPGAHKLRLDVWDSRDNISVLERNFTL